MPQLCDTKLFNSVVSLYVINPNLRASITQVSKKVFLCLNNFISVIFSKFFDKRLFAILIIYVYFLVLSVFSDIRGQFHQHSTGSVYVCKLQAQLFCAYILGFVFYWRKTVGTKAARRTLVKLRQGLPHCAYNVCVNRQWQQAFQQY